MTVPNPDTAFAWLLWILVAMLVMLAVYMLCFLVGWGVFLITLLWERIQGLRKRKDE